MFINKIANGNSIKISPQFRLKCFVNITYERNINVHIAPISKIIGDI